MSETAYRQSVKRNGADVLPTENYLLLYAKKSDFHMQVARWGCVLKTLRQNFSAIV